MPGPAAVVAVFADSDNCNLDVPNDICASRPNAIMESGNWDLGRGFDVVVFWHPPNWVRGVPHGRLLALEADLRQKIVACQMEEPVGNFRAPDEFGYCMMSQWSKGEIPIAGLTVPTSHLGLHCPSGAIMDENVNEPYLRLTVIAMPDLG